MNAFKGKLKLAANGKCVYCKGGSIDYDDTNFESGQVSQRADCADCGKQWFEVYKLCAIEKVEE